MRWHGGDRTELLFAPKHPHSWSLVCQPRSRHPPRVSDFMWLEGTQIDGGPREGFKVEPGCWALPVHEIKSLTGVQTRRMLSILSIRKDIIHRIKV